MLGLASAQPDIRVLPDNTHSFYFGSVEMYHLTKKTFYIENEGAKTLKIKKLYTSDSDNREFVIDATYTESDLEPGETTPFDVYFKPSAEQPTWVDVLIESNDPDEGLYQIYVNGIGAWYGGNPPMIVVMQGPSPVILGSDAYDFGSIDVGSSAVIDFTILNDPSADHELAVTDISFKSGDVTHFNRIASGLPKSLGYEAPDNSMDFMVGFSPPTDQITSSEPYSVEVEIISDDPDFGSFTFRVYGTGIAEPNIRVLDGSNEIPIDGTVDFGTVEYNQDEVTKSITIENTGSVDLSIDDIIVDDIDGDFSLTSPLQAGFPLTVTSGGSETITIRFKPVSGFDMFLQAEIEIYSNDPDEFPFHFYVEGYSESAQIPDINVKNESTGSDVPSHSIGHDFTTVGVATTVSVPFTIENKGNTDLSIGSINLSGDTSHFYLSSTPITPGWVIPDGSVMFEVTYAPTSTGTHSALISIGNSDPDTAENPYEFALLGKGAVVDVPDIEVKVGKKKIPNNGTYYFNDDDDALEYPESKKKKFTIKNTGKADLYISGVLIVSGDAEDFTVDLITPVTIKAGKEVDFDITFDPGKPQSELELRSARLQITNSDSDENPYKIDLYGWVELD